MRNGTWPAVFACVVVAAILPPGAWAAFPLTPDEGARVNGRDAHFRFGFDPGERRAKVILVDDATGGAYDPHAPVWEDQFRLESPWSTDGSVKWDTGVFPGFYTWRLCSVGDATDPDSECDLQPEIRSVRIGEGVLAPCRGEFASGFFRHLARNRTSCDTASAVMRSWVKRSRFGSRRPPKKLRVGAWTCRLRIFQTDENPYGQLTCRSGKRIMRNYGIS